MAALTQLGIFHTAVSLVAVGAGIVALARDREITPKNGTGKLYIVMTAVTCITGFGIFQHGGFNKAHVLGIITLVVLGLAGLAGSTRWFGRASAYIETVSYSATFFFHMIPGLTETATRLPGGAPLAASDESPGLKATIGVVFLLFLVGVALQVRRLRVRDRREEHGFPAAQNFS